MWFSATSLRKKTSAPLLLQKNIFSTNIFRKTMNLKNDDCANTVLSNFNGKHAAHMLVKGEVVLVLHFKCDWKHTIREPSMAKPFLSWCRLMMHLCCLRWLLCNDVVVFPFFKFGNWCHVFHAVHVCFLQMWHHLEQKWFPTVSNCIKCFSYCFVGLEKTHFYRRFFLVFIYIYLYIFLAQLGP